jgi:O-methyltransferase involved in polyketide biosynthesis
MRHGEKVSLTGEKATLLITLFGKAEESRLPDSLLKDRLAADAVSRIDDDFSKLKVRLDDAIGLAIRAHALDGWAREFLAQHPGATVLHLGCGLDTRVFRIDPSPSVRWFDVDYPEVAALRRRLYPARDAGYTLIGASVTDASWLDAVPRDSPVMIIAEGLLPYLPEDEVPRLFARVVGHFPSGEVAFDGYSRLGVRMLRNNRMIKATGASLHWGIDDPQELVRQVPSLRLVEERAIYDPAQMRRMSFPARVMIRLFLLVPALKRIGRLLRYRF